MKFLFKNALLVLPCRGKMKYVYLFKEKMTCFVKTIVEIAKY